MQFATTAERDAAFNRLLDRGAAVRAVDTEGGPALVVFGSASAFSDELSRASRVSLDAGVRVLATQPPARDTSIKRRQASSGKRLDHASSRGGMSVAIIDSGIAPHADLPLSRIRAYKDFVTGGTTPVDNCGHGTHVAGIVAGSGAHSNGAYAGIAPDVDIVALRVLGDDCSGNTSDVIDALEWIARQPRRLQHQGRQHLARPRRARVDLHRSAGAGGRALVAQGRRGRHRRRQQGHQPGDRQPGLRRRRRAVQCAVGDLRRLTRHQGHRRNSRTMRVSDSSSRGPTRFDLLAKPDLVAPGVNIVSLAAKGSRLFQEFPELRVPGANGRPRVLHAVGHEHGLARRGRHRGAVAAPEQAARRSTL